MTNPFAWSPGSESDERTVELCSLLFRVSKLQAENYRLQDENGQYKSAVEALQTCVNSLKDNLDSLKDSLDYISRCNGDK